MFNGVLKTGGRIQACNATIEVSLVPDKDISPTELAIAKRFAQLRKAKGLTQKELAQKLNVSQSVVSDYEHGALRLHGELIIQLAKLLNVGTDELLGLSAEPIPSPSLSRRLLKRMQAIEQLPKRDQDALLRTIDAFVTRTN
ncbi:helix-turn-helix domain-containing protein [Colwellia sp. MEBiC06753]